MPIYEYRCQDCRRLFQKLQPMSADTTRIACPTCGSRRVERQLSVFASPSPSGSPTQSSGCAPGGG